MCYNDRLSATTAAGICRMSLSAYTEGETTKRIEAVIEPTRWGKIEDERKNVYELIML